MHEMRQGTVKLVYARAWHGLTALCVPLSNSYLRVALIALNVTLLSPAFKSTL